MTSRTDIADLTAKCIKCGFCLEACPTFTETGLETHSPRGRIHLVRGAREGSIRWGEIRESLDTCLGCRACETACPSGVEYGHILELAREKLDAAVPNATADRLLGVMTKPGLFRLAVAAGQIIPPALTKVATGLDVPTPEPQVADSWPPLDKFPNPIGRVAVLEGCVMPTMFARVREATLRLLKRVGLEPVIVRGCCGALHAHQGHLQEGSAMLGSVDRAREDLLLVTDVAGCGSWLKDGLNNVRDITEVLVDHGLIAKLQQLEPLKIRVAYHDACHLAHGQHIRSLPRELLAAIPGVELIALPEGDTCCGSAGIYNLLQPKLARQLLDRKWGHIASTGADVVAMGNAGCHAWIQQAAREQGGAVKVMHTVEILEAAFSGWPE